MHPHPNLADGISAPVQTWMRSFGWKPGLPSKWFLKWKYGKSLDAWREYCSIFKCRRSASISFDKHPAWLVLRELRGLQIRCPEHIKHFRDSFDFVVEEWISMNDEVSDLSDYVDDFLLPIASSSYYAIVSIGITGRVFLSGVAQFGVLFKGESFGEAMNRVYTGLPGNPVRIEDARFKNLDLDNAPDWVFTPPPISAD